MCIFPFTRFLRFARRPLSLAAVAAPIALAVCLLASVARAADPAPASAAPAWRTVGQLEAATSPEASGMVASNRYPGILWLIDDSGNAPQLTAIDLTGALRARVRVKDVRNRDWEDLAAFTLDGTPYLMVADVGDNDARRQDLALHVLVEPELPPAAVGPAAPETPAKLDATLAWSLPFAYPDGPRDCEAVAVDAASATVLLISKRQMPPQLYTLPLKPTAVTAPDAPPARLTAKLLGPVALPGIDLAILNAPDGFERAARSQMVTALDLAPDASSAVLVTYTQTCRYTRRGLESWGAVFLRAPTAVALPKEPQIESICLVPATWLPADGATAAPAAEATTPAAPAAAPGMVALVVSEMAGGRKRPILALPLP